MNPDELRALQAPLKLKYRDEPTAALIMLRAEGRVGDGISCKIRAGKGSGTAGLHPAAGGDGMQLCAGEMLLDALVACAGVTLSAVATSMGIVLCDAVIEATAEMDMRGTLGVFKSAPVGFSSIKLNFKLKSQASSEQLDTLIRLTERYCVVYQTLRVAPAIATTRSEIL